MFLFETSLADLFEINARRQQEMDDLFAHMGRHPSSEALMLLHHHVTHSVPEAEALLEGIKAAFLNVGKPQPDALVPKMLMQLALLPEQIAVEKKLITYLEHEHQ